MKKVSIIVPVYNVEKYIRKCLQSLVEQKYQNYDVIVVNDGTKDNSQTIIDEYVEMYPNIIKSYIKENGGYGSALTYGFKHSDADFVLVCDSDDYLEHDALETLMSLQEKYDSDITIGCKTLFYEDSLETKYDKCFNEDYSSFDCEHYIVQGQDKFEDLYFIDPSPHSKLYRKEIVEKIKFENKVSFNDNLLYFYSLNHARKVCYTNKSLSNYLINRTGNTMQDKSINVINSWIKVYNSIFQQKELAPTIFYFRMFTIFMFIFYELDFVRINYKDLKIKYEEIYFLLEKLLKYQEHIEPYILKFEENNIIKQQQLNLIKEETSYMQYKKLVRKKLFKSILKGSLWK